MDFFFLFRVVWCGESRKHNSFPGAEMNVRATGLFLLLLSGYCGIQADGWIGSLFEQFLGIRTRFSPYFSIIPVCGGEMIHANFTGEFGGLK